MAVPSTLSDFGLGFGVVVGVGVSTSEIGAGRRGAVINKSGTVRSGMSVRFKERITSGDNKQFSREGIFDFAARGSASDVEQPFRIAIEGVVNKTRSLQHWLGYWKRGVLKSGRCRCCLWRGSRCCLSD